MTREEFVRLAGDESGLPLDVGDLTTSLDTLAGWDSVHLLKLVSALEAAGDQTLPVMRVLQARTLGEIHALVAR